jgi:PelA/Pel-15E family pectate lyase
MFPGLWHVEGANGRPEIRGNGGVMYPRRVSWFHWGIAGLLMLAGMRPAAAQDDTDKELLPQAVETVARAASYFHQSVAVHGGYVYEVSLDLKQRRGEGEASPTTIWVQPPGTPAVGMAFVKAYAATKDPQLLAAAVDAANALVYGQLKSGGWTDRIDFDPTSRQAWQYRNGRGNAKGKNVSTLDDDKSQSAIRLLIEVDAALGLADVDIHNAAISALDALLAAQFANGGFPQGWSGPVDPGTVSKASFPDYDWRTEGRIKEYWDYETLNDGLAGTVTETLMLAHRVYGDDRYRDALLKFGDFLIRAQLPEPQPAWAQQYNHQLQPMWARKFEPPAVAGRESEDVIATLMTISEYSGEKRFLEPIPAALEWLRRSRLPDGRIARFYELQTNRPLYFVRDGETYTLIYDDSDLPTHYGFQTECHLDELEARFRSVSAGEVTRPKVRSLKSLRKDAIRLIGECDSLGRWVTDADDKPVMSPPPDAVGLQLNSKVFIQNMTRLSEYISAARDVPASQ